MAMLTTDILIPLLAFAAVVAIGGAVLAARAARSARLKARLEGAGDEHVALLHPSERPMGPLGRLLGRVGTLVSSRGSSTSLKEELAKAGYYGKGAVACYLGCKMLLLVVGGSLSASFVVPMAWPMIHKVFWIGCGVALPFFLPNAVVRMRKERRAADIRRHLPDALDLMEICVSSGMGLDMAWNSVADEIRRVSPALADEMSLTNLEMHLGTPRPLALKHMAERAGVQEISSLVAVLVQSDRFGTSVVEAIRQFAASMRLARTQNAEETAEKMAVKLLFPMVLFIFPAVLIVLVGPAALQLARMIGTY